MITFNLLNKTTGFLFSNAYYHIFQSKSLLPLRLKYLSGLEDNKRFIAANSGYFEKYFSAYQTHVCYRFTHLYKHKS